MTRCAGRLGCLPNALAFSAAHLGELACAIRDANECAAGNGGLGVTGDGAALRSSLASAVAAAESIARLLRGTNLAQRAAKKSREVVISS